MAAASDFNTLHQNIMGADVEHTAAKTALDAASARHATARDALSAHQKAFDDAVATFRSSQPHDPGSYWGQAAPVAPAATP